MVEIREEHMTEKEINEAIETILYNASYTSVSVPGGRRFYETERDGKGGIYKVFSNKTVTLLLALYQKLTTEDKKALLLKILTQKPSISNLFLQQLAKSSRYAFKHQDFVFIFFIRIKRIDQALDMINNEILISSMKNDLFVALSENLETEPDTFDNGQLNKILGILENYQSFIAQKKNYDVNKRIIDPNSRQGIPTYDTNKVHSYKSSDSHAIPACERLIADIRDTVYRIKETRLASSLLEGINWEINQDQEQLQLIISDFGFNPKLNETLNKINQSLYEAKDNFDFKNCIDLIRAFLNELCISIGLKINKEKGILPSEPINEMGKAMNYFRDSRVQFFSKEEDELVMKFNAFISRKGVHALQSEREYARISKNLVIELGLFLVERLKKYLSNP